MTDGAVTFFQAVCPVHEYKGETVQRPAFANIEAETHEQIKDCGSSHIREFESEAVGSLPRNTPPAEFDDNDGGEA